MLFSPLPFVCHSIAVIFAPLFIEQGSLYINEALGYKELNLSDVWQLSLSPSLLNSLLLTFDLTNQSGVQMSLNQA